MFRGYDPYIEGLKPSFFQGVGVQRYMITFNLAFGHRFGDDMNFSKEPTEIDTTSERVQFQ